ncbi:MAG: hypothetical protein J6R06_06500 [Bacteroidales bacterium]|nr:hypothetical protein [Bacteroidales bacterium]
MLKCEDIINLAKECKLEVNEDFEFEFSKIPNDYRYSIYHFYALLLEIKDRFELLDYFYLTNQDLPPMLENERTEDILEELLQNHIILGY